MFCGNCGTKIEDGARFCANCGTPVQIEAEESVQETVETAAPAVETVQETVGTAAPTVEAVQETVEIAVPAVEAVQETVEIAVPAVEAVQDTVGTAAPTVEAVQETVETAAPTVEAVQETFRTAAPIEPLQPEQPVQNIAPAPCIQPEQTVQPTPSAEPVMPAAKKKKSKAPLIAGITAGAVLLGGGAAGYFFFHDDITRLFMGSKEYAKMIDKKSFESVDLLDPTSKTYLNYAVKAFDSAASSTVKSLKTTNTTSEQSLLSNTANQAVGFADPSLAWALFDLLPEETSVSVETGLDVKLGSMLALINNESLSTIIDALNEYTITGKFANSSVDMCSYGIKDSSGNSGSVEVYTEKDGGFLITFPGISEKKIYISKEDIDAARGNIEETSSERVKLDTKEFKRILTEITDIYYKAYDNAEITYTGNVEWTQSSAGSAGELTTSVKGTEVAVSFTADQVKDIVRGMIEHIRDDAYLNEYFTGLLKISEEDYKKMFDPEKSVKTINFGLSVKHIVDGHNNVLASGYTLVPDSGKGTFEIKKIDGNGSGALTFDYTYETGSISNDGNASSSSAGTSIICVYKETEKNSGNAVIHFTIKAQDKITDIALECTYSGVGVKKFLGHDVKVGRYEIKLSDPDKVAETVGSLVIGSKTSSAGNETVAKTMTETQTDASGNAEKILDELKKFIITLDTSIDGEVLSSSFSLSLGDLGEIGIHSRMDSKHESITLPDTSGAYKITDADMLADLGTDGLNWVKKMTSSLDSKLGGSISKSIDSAIARMEAEKNIIKHYAAYNSSSKYSANNYAYEIMEALNSQIANNATGSGVIKLYFKDGKAEIIDDGGIAGLSCDGCDLDSVYAEVIYDKRVGDGITGVSTVLTDNKSDLPSVLPNIYNYIDYVYPWGDNQGVIGEFVVGTNPYLYTGEPTTTELPEGDLDAARLNEYAKYIADAVTDYIGRSGDISKYTESKEKDAIIAFCKAKLTGWYDIGEYAGTKKISDGGFSEDFINEITSRLNSLSEEHSDMTDLHTALYFRDSKFVGVMTSQYGNIYYDDSGIPTPVDYASGSFSGWQDSNADGVPDAGSVYNFYQDLKQIGTYSVSTGKPLTVSVASELGDSKIWWRVTAINGQSLAELAESYGVSESMLEIYIAVDDENAYFTSYSYDEPLSMKIVSGEEYEGKPAVALINESNDVKEGYIVFDDDKNARLIDEINEVKYDLEIMGALTGTVGNISDPVIDEIAGVWTGTYDNTDLSYSISTNYVFAKYDENGWITNSEFLLMNPSDSGYNAYDITTDTLLLNATIKYDRDSDTIELYDSAIGKTLSLKRAESGKTYDYFGQWTLETYEGLSMDDYCSKYNKTPDEFAMNIDIGAYSGLSFDTNGWRILTMKAPDKNTFKLAFDSSMFLDCTYDPQTDKITAVLRFDDSSNTQTAIFCRGEHAFG